MITIFLFNWIELFFIGNSLRVFYIHFSNQHSVHLLWLLPSRMLTHNNFGGLFLFYNAWILNWSERGTEYWKKVREKLAHRRIKLAVISKYRRPWAERPRKGLFKHILCFGRACSWCQPPREGAEGLGSSPQPSPKRKRVPSLWLYRFTAASAEVSVVNKFVLR